MHLAPGDTVVLYTDGVTEAHHRNQELFGEERLVEVIRHAGDDVDEVADAIIAAVSDYGPVEPRDDVAVVSCGSSHDRLGRRVRDTREQDPSRARARGDGRDRSRRRPADSRRSSTRSSTTRATTGLVDLSGVTFIDSSGVRELLAANREAEAKGRRLRAG